MLAVVGGKEGGTAMAFVEVAGNASSVVRTTCGTEEYFARRRIVEVPSVRRTFMDFKQLQSWTVGVVVCQMDGIAMSVACGTEHLSVVVESGRAPYNFVASVAIDIAYRHVVVAVAIHGAATIARSGCWCVVCLCRPVGGDFVLGLAM